MRDKLSEAIKEFEAVIKPDTSRIVYLGTPQTEQSIYNKLQEEVIRLDIGLLDTQVRNK